MRRGHEGLPRPHPRSRPGKGVRDPCIAKTADFRQNWFRHLCHLATCAHAARGHWPAGAAARAVVTELSTGLDTRHSDRYKHDICKRGFVCCLRGRQACGRRAPLAGPPPGAAKVAHIFAISLHDAAPAILAAADDRQESPAANMAAMRLCPRPRRAGAGGRARPARRPGGGSLPLCG